MTQVNQDALDYSNEAHMRACVRTKALQKVSTFQLVPGVQEYAVPSDAYEILSLSIGTTLLAALSPEQALALLSGTQDSSGDIRHYLIGGHIGFIPTPTEAALVTVYYNARPAPLTSNTPFEVSGDYEILIEHQTLAYTLADDGQTGLAITEQAFCDAEYQKLQSRPRHAQRYRSGAAGEDQAI